MLVTFTKVADRQMNQVQVDGVELIFVHGVATRDLPLGQHALSWQMAGDPGDTITITVTPECMNVLPFSSTVPPGEHQTAGYGEFLVVECQDA